VTEVWPTIDDGEPGFGGRCCRLRSQRSLGSYRHSHLRMHVACGLRRRQDHRDGYPRHVHICSTTHHLRAAVQRVLACRFYRSRWRFFRCLLPTRHRRTLRSPPSRMHVERHPSTQPPVTLLAKSTLPSRPVSATNNAKYHRQPRQCSCRRYSAHSLQRSDCAEAEGNSRSGFLQPSPSAIVGFASSGTRFEPSIVGHPAYQSTHARTASGTESMPSAASVPTIALSAQNQGSDITFMR